MLSVIIPSRNEIYLQKTIDDVLSKSKRDIEIIAILDGYWPDPPLKDDPRLKIIHHGTSHGMRGSINAGVAVAKGDLILKCDAHCMFAEGFDITLEADCDENWVVIPRRKRLDARNWTIEQNGRPDVDYEYLSYPNVNGNWNDGLHGRVWEERALKRADILIDDNMSAQGSCWMMHRDYFNKLELEDEEHYGTFSNEFQEIGLKCWLSGGRVITNKKTWYAHLHKDKDMGRGYSLPGDQVEKGFLYTNRWLTNTAWHKQIHPFTWLIERFWPVPGWPEDKAKWQK